MTTAECIKFIRLQLGRSQSEFGQLIGKDKTSICMYESGKRVPSFPTVRSIFDLAKKHGLKISYTDIRNN